ncbi:Alpha/Beta hydrolase protein [Dimargaris cristalligena]|uniref:Alpha/Beta hydrolase protein n=1 Tax=Dimargaris cristalligena TaxID=215637 RepID=A0A4P9ZWD2_9FUNG|nr:Alpha/Beta hydrolase protein [Dimargaris cristalligena]|eukprot:RKP37955.1 Alpha/Beta hydrolase protein [Dimargaris cristalligena]
MGLVSWEQQIKHFTGANASTNGEEYTLLLFDNRGTGWSDTPSGLYTSQAMAYDTLALLDHLDWRSDVHVVGVSLGGMIIQELARVADLDRFSTFAFLSTTPGRVLFPWSTMYLFLKLAFTQDLEAKFHLANSLLFPSKWLEQPYQSSAVDPDYPPNRVRTNLDFVREGGRIRTPFARLQTFNGFLGQLSACLRHSTSAACLEPLSKHPRIRCLVLTGTDDRMVPPVDSLDLASHLAAPILVFSGSGHVLPLEQASRLNLVLHKHFNGEETASF